MLKKIVATAVLLSAAWAHAFAPQAGTWVVSSEVDGKPGRGMAVDVQNGTLLLQMYAYESSGQPTFYLAVGSVVDNKVTAPLTRYTGGRYLGSGALSGTAAGSPGNVTVRFTSGTTGYITFPNEPEKAIARFNFGYPAAPSSLKGLWSLTSLGSEGFLGDAVNLTTTGSATSTGNGLVISSDGLFGCEHQVSGNLAGLVLCVKVSSQGQLLRGYAFVYSVNEGEGYSQYQGTGSQQMLFIRRLTTAQGAGTGLAYKSDETSAGEHPALRFHLSNIAAQN